MTNYQGKCNQGYICGTKKHRKGTICQLANTNATINKTTLLTGIKASQDNLPTEITELSYIDNKSDKFYRIETTGNTVTITYGRNGTNGVQTVKEFPNAETASSFANKQLATKIRKGYRQTLHTIESPSMDLGDAELNSEYMKSNLLQSSAINLDNKISELVEEVDDNFSRKETEKKIGEYLRNNNQILDDKQRESLIEAFCYASEESTYDWKSNELLSVYRVDPDDFYMKLAVREIIATYRVSMGHLGRDSDLEEIDDIINIGAESGVLGEYNSVDFFYYKCSSISQSEITDKLMDSWGKLEYVPVEWDAFELVFLRDDYNPEKHKEQAIDLIEMQIEMREDPDYEKNAIFYAEDIGLNEQDISRIREFAEKVNSA